MLKDFVDKVEYDIWNYARYRSRMSAIYVCAAGDQGILQENMKTPCAAVDVLPELRIHGVPVRVAKRMAPGRFLYVLKGEK